MSRFDAKFFDMTIFGSHAGNNAAADTPALAPRNWRRESSLYSSQPQSMSCSSSIVTLRVSTTGRRWR